MARVYSSSYLTIAATAGIDPHKSLFFERWTTYTDTIPIYSYEPETFILPLKDIDLSSESHPGAFARLRPSLGHATFAGYPGQEENLSDSPLLTRAWAFQERFLPARTLHFHAEELIWECRSLTTCECAYLQALGGKPHFFPPH